METLKFRKKLTDHLDENDNGEESPPLLSDVCKAVLRGKILYIALIKINK